MNFIDKLVRISNLSVKINDKVIIDSLFLDIGYGETHVIMGPNGTGKSTLARVLSGDIRGLKLSGDIFFEGKCIKNFKPEELSLKGIFLAFQYPVVIPGLSNLNFFKSFIDNKRKIENLDPIDLIDFNSIVNKLMEKLNINKEFLNRSVNDGFSGGEKKKNEILQMMLLEPKFAILDEIDSGLDIDSLKCIAKNILSLYSSNNSRLIITHYNRILNYINVDYVHVLRDGKIIKTGNMDIVDEIEKVGYINIK